MRNKWQLSGQCPYVDRCRFAHGRQELRPVVRDSPYKTKPCRTMLAGKMCPYGHRCLFSHSLTEEEKPLHKSPNSSKIIHGDISPSRQESTDSEIMLHRPLQQLALADKNQPTIGIKLFIREGERKSMVNVLTM
ncbi:Zinc finger CCCH domain-containing protein 15 [Nymphaea thermarum]|nr:Zinc finger CCCH domain-containing protein 15 [Nymphaea thermarum]